MSGKSKIGVQAPVGLPIILPALNRHVAAAIEIAHHAAHARLKVKRSRDRHISTGHRQ